MWWSYKETFAASIFAVPLATAFILIMRKYIIEKKNLFSLMFTSMLIGAILLYIEFFIICCIYRIERELITLTYILALQACSFGIITVIAYSNRKFFFGINSRKIVYVDRTAETIKESDDTKMMTKNL